MQEWSAEEVAEGLHQPSMRFAMESKSQRGWKERKMLEENGAMSQDVAVKPASA